MNTSLIDTIEILSVNLLDNNRALINEIKQLARSLELEFGWHYLLDLAWIITKLDPIEGNIIVDAGAGTGILQWYLAKKGATVISVDRTNRKCIPLKFRRRFNTKGYLENKLAEPICALFQNIKAQKTVGTGISYLLHDVTKFIYAHPVEGNVLLYDQDLHNLSVIPSASVGYVVALSALEHNPPNEIPIIVDELLRIIRPGGALIATLGAARDHDWFHQPSQGWCYTEETLRKIFSIPSDTPSNYQQYDKLFTELYNCSELRDNLAKFYFKSGNNGMPWGRWEPQYQSVGVVKVKQITTKTL